MICEGSLLSNRTSCLSCGTSVYNKLPNSSAFTRYSCDNKECEDYGVLVTIEKCSNTVFNIYPPFIIGGKRAFPKVLEFTDADGKVIWPLPDPPEQTQTSS